MSLNVKFVFLILNYVLPLTRIEFFHTIMNPFQLAVTLSCSHYFMYVCDLPWIWSFECNHWFSVLPVHSFDVCVSLYVLVPIAVLDPSGSEALSFNASGHTLMFVCNRICSLLVNLSCHSGRNVLCSAHRRQCAVSKVEKIAMNLEFSRVEFYVSHIKIRRLNGFEFYCDSFLMLIMFLVLALCGGGLYSRNSSK
jgi:hypothetical protein